MFKTISNLLFLLCFICLSCGPDEKVDQKSIQVQISKFNQDSAFQYVKTQVDMGPRYVNSEGHKACKKWLTEKLAAFDFEVITQDFSAKAYDGTDLYGTNIIGRYNQEVKQRVVLAAHWDTRHIADKDSTNKTEPILGADDGASGVGVLLEIARQLKEHPIPMGVDIVFFDAEDYGADSGNLKYTWGLGSQYWAKNLHEDNYQVKYGILVDMVGAKEATFYKEGVSMQVAPQVTNDVWKLAQQMGYSNFFKQGTAPPMVDDHLFVYENAGIPMIDIINMNIRGRFKYYHHTRADAIDIIDKKTLMAVGQVVLAKICRESNSFTPASE